MHNGRSHSIVFYIQRPHLVDTPHAFCSLFHKERTYADGFVLILSESSTKANPVFSVPVEQATVGKNGQRGGTRGEQLGCIGRKTHKSAQVATYQYIY